MILDIVEHSSEFALDGYWSGTEERHHEPFVGIIPATRYVWDEPSKPAIKFNGELKNDSFVPTPAVSAPKKKYTKKHVRVFSKSDFCSRNFKNIRQEFPDIEVRKLLWDYGRSKSSYINEFLSWVSLNADGYYGRHTPKIEGHAMSDKFMVALISEFHTNKDRLRAFFFEYL